MNKYKKIILFVIVLVSTISVILVNVDFDVKREENSEKYIEEKTISKPSSIQAYTLEGEKTNLSYDFLIKNNLINGITCKNGTVATYNKTTNEVSLSNIKIPDYCTMDFKHSIYSKLLADNKAIKTRTDFSSVFTETNTGTLYKATESIAGSTPKDVYYFAGNAQNNWVKFAGYYWRIIRTNHDGSVRLLYAGTSPDTTEGYIGTSTFNSNPFDPMYVGYMYGTSGTLASNRTNENSSTIKGVMDTWYSNNLSSYSKYISTETVYCNDREVIDYNTSNDFDYYVYTRINTEKQPTYNCLDSKDAFSGSNIEAKLTYPIGLMTADEIVYAGGYRYSNNASAWYYLNSIGSSISGNQSWWLLSPLYWLNNFSHVWSMGDSSSPGSLGSGSVDASLSIRPVISLKGNLIWKSGDGSSASPYEVEDLPPTLSEKLLSDNPTIKTRTDFSATFTETNTGTLYKTTESIAGSTPKDVYYFAGDAKNNWVKFGGFYWRIIRTNHDGSVRLLYAGTSPDTTKAYIGSSKFNENYNSPKYVGYMYGNSDTTPEEARTNTNDSTIKTYIDNWYEKNLTTYTNYLSNDAVYCNDRSVTNGEEYSLTSTFFYSGYYRTHYIKGLFTEVNFNCPNIKDAFSVYNTEAKLKYPIALITGEEIVAAGGKVDTNATVWYSLNSDNESITGNEWWSTMTPDYFNTTTSNVWRIVGTENLGRYRGGYVYYVNSVRPVISIASCALYSSGDGSAETPYEIVENGGC